MTEQSHVTRRKGKVEVRHSPICRPDCNRCSVHFQRNRWLIYLTYSSGRYAFETIAAIMFSDVPPTKKQVRMKLRQSHKYAAELRREREWELDDQSAPDETYTIKA